jgi:LacI family gluconate utilization system Gnt-I transcriptional repressor
MTTLLRSRRPSARPTTGAPRLEDVARVAGVSAMTVSRAFTHPEKVAQNTYRHVVNTATALGYIPDLNARSLSTTRTGMIAVVIPSITNSVLADLVSGMSDVLQPDGFHLLIGGTGFSLEKEEAIVRAFLARRPDGIYVTGTAHTDGTRHLLSQAGVPVVEGCNLTDRPIDMVVGISNFEAARAVVRHLIARGHRRIAYVGSDHSENDRVRDRYLGYRAALEEVGIDPADNAAIFADFEMESGARAVAMLMGGEAPAPTAIFFSVDMLAAGGIFECQRRGIGVPGDLAIAGFGNHRISGEIVPKLTTAGVSGYRIGTQTADLLRRRFAKETIAERVIDMGYELIVREST